MRRRRALLLAATFMVLFFLWQNNSIVVSTFEYEDPKVAAEFDGFTIVQISDLHNKEFGPGQKELKSKVKNLSPDLIVLTGDLIDRRKYDLDVALKFAEGAVDLAPVYFVSGNHEAWSGQYEEIRSRLRATGVVVLDDAQAELVRDGSAITISGLLDPDFLTSSYAEGTVTSKAEAQLNLWSSQQPDSGNLQILLSHRPELFDLYRKSNMDLVFSGHTHGGQIRIPGVGALFAPDQGLFPTYDSGCYTEGSTSLFVSRGLGNSILPIRIFNRPEILVVVLRTEK